MKRWGKKKKEKSISHVAESVLCLRIQRLEIKSSLLWPVAEHMLISTEAKVMLFLCKRPPMGKLFTYLRFSCLKEGTIPTSFTSKLWNFSVRKVILLNKKKKALYKGKVLLFMELREIRKYSNKWFLHFKRLFFFKKARLPLKTESLRVAISILFQNVLLYKDTTASNGTHRNLCDESAWKYCSCSESSSSVCWLFTWQENSNHRYSTLSRNVLPSFKTQPGSLDSLGLQKERKKNTLKNEFYHYHSLGTGLLFGVMQEEKTISVSGS